MAANTADVLRIMSESSAPDPQSAQTPAANLHPFFTGRGRGGARGRGRGRTADSEPQAEEVVGGTSGPRLVPIDFGALESGLRGTNEDAESEILSDEDDQLGECAPPAKRPRAERAAAAANAVAFAGEDDEVSEVAETSSQAGSEQVLDRQISASKRIFRVRGVSCLGCALDQSIIGKVDTFIEKNQTRLEPVALFKSASMFFKNNVCDNASIQDGQIPLWPWKDLRSHYVLHSVNPQFQRIDSLRSLAACRKTIESSLIRVDEEGQRTLDPKNSDLLLKIITLQSRELGLLTSAAMPPPPPRGR